MKRGIFSYVGINSLEIQIFGVKNSDFTLILVFRMPESDFFSTFGRFFVFFLKNFFSRVFYPVFFRFFNELLKKNGVEKENLRVKYIYLYE